MQAIDLATLEQAVSRYAQFIWDHMGREEGVILPAAQKYLTDEDWAAIDGAFATNNDPRFAARHRHAVPAAVLAHRQPGSRGCAALEVAVSQLACRFRQ